MPKLFFCIGLGIVSLSALKLGVEAWQRSKWRRFLKSRVQNLQDRDVNTKFFHISTVHRWRKNWILGLHDTVDNWTLDHNIIHSFVKLFLIIFEAYKTLNCYQVYTNVLFFSPFKIQPLRIITLLRLKFLEQSTPSGPLKHRDLMAF